MKLMNLGVAVKPKVEEKKEQSGLLIIPETAKITSKYKEGVVMFVGEGTKHRPMEVAVGETIMYKKANYPTSGECEIIDLNDVLYVL